MQGKAGGIDVTHEPTDPEITEAEIEARAIYLCESPLSPFARSWIEQSSKTKERFRGTAKADLIAAAKMRNDENNT